MSGIAIQGLVVGQGGFRAGPFALHLRPGRPVAVIGPNGSGKTTFLKTLAGLLPPVAGAVVPSPSAAYLPPPGAIAADFEAVHVVALGRAARRRWAAGLALADHEAALAALRSLGVGALADRSFGRLSSGQQQLVLIARLLVQDAPLCLLDEPTAMLDPSQIERVDRAIVQLAADGRIVAVSTHRLDFAARCACVIAIGGRVEVGEPAGMLTAERLSALYGTQLSTVTTSA